MRSATPSQPAMTGAHAQGCALSLIAGNTRRTPTVTNCLAPNLEGGADHGSVVFCDGKHLIGVGTLSVRAFSDRGKSLGDSRIGSALIQAACWRRRPACMGKALSVDLREWVVAAIAGGMSRRAAPRRSSR